MLSQKQISTAKIKYESGESLKIIAKYFNISRSSLGRLFRINGIAIRTARDAHRSGSKIPHEIQNKIFDMNSKRVPLLEICKKLNVSYGALHSLLKKNNLLWGRRFKDLPKEKIIQDYNQGSTINQLGAKYSSNPKTIKKILEKNETPIRSFQDYKQDIPNLSSLYEDMIQNNKSLKTIASSIGISKFILKERFIEKDFKLRSKSEEQEITNLEKYPDFDFDFFSRETPEVFYWIGFIAADGAVIGKLGSKLKLTMNLKYSDKTHLQKLRTLLKHGTISQSDMSKYEYKIGDKKFRGTKMVKFDLSSSKLCRSLVDHGITPQKTHSLALSERLKSSKDFWRGYIDGDGSITPLRNSKGNISTVLMLGGGSRRVLEDFSEFLISLGVTVPAISVVHYKKPFYKVHVSGERARHVIKFLYEGAPVSARLERKYKIAMTWIKWSSDQPQNHTNTLTVE